MMKLNLDKKSMETFEKNLSRVAETLYRKSHSILLEIAKNIADISYDLVPVDTGSLSSSLYIASEFTNDAVKFYVGYGGDYAKTNYRTGKSTATYDLMMHEIGPVNPINLSLGRGMKFLEIPVNAARVTFENDIAKMLRTVFMSSLHGVPMPTAVNINYGIPHVVVGYVAAEAEKLRKEMAEYYHNKRKNERNGG